MAKKQGPSGKKEAKMKETVNRNKEQPVFPTAGSESKNAPGKEAAGLKAQGLQILADYPNEQKIYMTANGFGFFKYTDAYNHAETLTDKTILTINRK